MSRSPLVTVVLACLLLALPSTADAGKRTVPHGWLGAVADGPMTDPTDSVAGDWHLMAESGVENVRTAFYWPYAQPSADAPADLSRFDAVVLAAARERLPVLPVVEGTPGWAASQAFDETSPPRDPAMLAAFMRALVARYGPSGTLWAEHPEVVARPIRAWQIGNEPNLKPYFNPPPGQSYAVAYTATLRTAATAVRRADPGAKIVLAGLTNRSWIALKAIYKAGARNAFDVVALHPYTSKPRDVLRILKLNRRVMRRAGDGRKPLWVTEMSWPSAAGRVKDPGGISTTEGGQAKKLRRGLQLLAHARKPLRIRRVYWYTWLSEEAGGAFQYSGLRRFRGGQVVSTPALAAFRSVAARLYGR